MLSNPILTASRSPDERVKPARRWVDVAIDHADDEHRNVTHQVSPQPDLDGVPVVIRLVEPLDEVSSFNREELIQLHRPRRGEGSSPISIACGVGICQRANLSLVSFEVIHLQVLKQIKLANYASKRVGSLINGELSL